MPVDLLSGDIMNANQLMNQVAIGDVNPVTKGSWLASADKLETINTLKNLAIGNCRLLFGSERFKFYDIVICESEETGVFCSLLTCNQDAMTKILRSEFSDCPVKAVRQMVDRLQKDTGLLFTKYTVGAQLQGQQGYTNKETGKFELAEFRGDRRIEGPDDDTQGLVSRRTDAPGGVPRAPRADRWDYKRPRTEQTDGFLDYDG